MTLKYEHLVGRSYLPGVRDCYGQLRELYNDNFGIELTNYARPHDWSSDKDDLIRKLYERDGFEMITHWRLKDIRPADVLALAVGESNPNLLSIYVGDNLMMHHLHGRMSNVETYRDFWRNSTCFVLRHPAVPDLRPVRPDTTIMEILNGRRPS